MKTFINKHSVTLYFALTFILTWGCMALVLGPGGFPLTVEQFEAVGPLVYTAMLVGPSAAGILMTGLVDGKAGFRELLSRLCKWRVGIRWYVVALLTALLSTVVILLALSIFSPEFLPTLLTSDDKLSLLLTGITMGLIVGFFEELGWTGFAVPRIKQRHGVLVTGLIVGFLWGAWHFIVFWRSDSFSGVLPLALLLACLFSGLPAYRVLMVWVYDHTDSLLIAILMHAGLTGMVVIEPPLTGESLLTYLLVRAVVLWVLVAAVVVPNRMKNINSQTIRLQGEN